MQGNDCEDCFSNVLKTIEILREDVATIRFLSKLIGNLVAAFPTFTLGPFYYRALEMGKTKARQQSNGNYDASVRLSKETKKELC